MYLKCRVSQFLVLKCCNLLYIGCRVEESALFMSNLKEIFGGCSDDLQAQQKYAWLLYHYRWLCFQKTSARYIFMVVIVTVTLEKVYGPTEIISSSTGSFSLRVPRRCSSHFREEIFFFIERGLSLIRRWNKKWWDEKVTQNKSPGCCKFPQGSIIIDQLKIWGQHFQFGSKILFPTCPWFSSNFLWITI